MAKSNINILVALLILGIIFLIATHTTPQVSQQPQQQQSSSGSVSVNIVEPEPTGKVTGLASVSVQILPSGH